MCDARGVRLIRLVLLLGLVILAAMPVGATDGLRVEIDRERIAVNETLMLRLIVEGKTLGEPDLAPLDQDFEILGRRENTRMSIVNGVMSHTLEWTLELVPKRAGRLEIPALTWGRARSAPRAVEVIEDVDQTGGADGAKPLFVEAEVSVSSPYVQQPLHYRVKVLYRETPTRALIAEPKVEGATLERDGPDRSYAELIGGQRYQVVERRFLLVPQRSGTLIIEGPRLEAMLPPRDEGRLMERSDMDDGFGGSPFAGLPGLGGGRRLVEHAPDLELQVRPMPADAPLPWLPAESVQLTEEWSRSPPEPQVGEPITRILTLTARGLTAAQLPPLDPPALDGAQLYLDRMQTEDLPGEGTPVALQRVEVVLVPTREGVLTLPEVRVHWWDTQTDAPRVATVPAGTLTVAAAPPGATSEPLDAMPDPLAVAPPERIAERPDLLPRLMAALDPKSGVWPWISAALALGWLLTMLRLVRRRAASVTDAKPRGGAEKRLRQAREALRAACEQDDARAARAALLDWGRACWPSDPPLGLSALAERLADPNVVAILGALDRAVYTNGAEGWRGAGAWTDLDDALPQRCGESPTRSARGPQLPELYPRRV